MHHQERRNDMTASKHQLRILKQTSRQRGDVILVICPMHVDFSPFMANNVGPAENFPSGSARFP
jgi:hypothetical protein